MTLYTAWRIDEKGVMSWLEGIVADSDMEAWDKGSAILEDWLKLRPRQKSVLVIETDVGIILRNRPTAPMEPDIAPRDPDPEEGFSFNESTPPYAITGALTPAQKAGVLVELLRGLQVNSVVGCLDLAADENPMILKLWLAQLEVVARNKSMAHDEITVRSILGNPQSR